VIGVGFIIFFCFRFQLEAFDALAGFKSFFRSTGPIAMRVPRIATKL
jgi:hypothetical protein